MVTDFVGVETILWQLFQFLVIDTFLGGINDINDN